VKIKTTILHSLPFRLIFVALIFCLDRLSKFITKGVGEGVLNSSFLGVNSTVVLLVVLVCLPFFFFWLYKKDEYFTLGKDMLLVGALSNVFDRLMFGGVWDWLPMPFGLGLNNLADWSIVLGCLSILIIKDANNPTKN